MEVGCIGLGLGLDLMLAGSTVEAEQRHDSKYNVCKDAFA